MKKESSGAYPPPEFAELLTESEAAAILNMTPRMLADRRRAGKISSVKDGHVIGYTLHHIAEYQRRFQRKGKSGAELDTETLIAALRKQLLRK
jgi:hypothetical protein